MQLTFYDIEKAFEVDEATLYKWLNSGKMPAVKANDQYYFNSVEVLEWALKTRIPLTPGALELCEKNRNGQEIFTPALIAGGIYPHLQGDTREEVLNKVLDHLPLPAHIQKAQLSEILLCREQLGTTGIGDGIAIPHVKHPVILAGLDPIVGLFFLDKPMDFGSLDGKDVHILFVILSPSFKKHLSLLSRLAFCLQDTALTAALNSQTSKETIIASFHVAEAKVIARSVK